LRSIFDLLLHYGYVILFVSVFAEQVGLPVPAAPLLLAMGMFAGMGKLSVVACLALATAGAVLGDSIWYDLGRRRGHAILSLLCKVSLEPDSCVSNTKQKWNRFGAYTLILAKFVPGLSTVAPPLAGLTRMRFGQFLVFDIIGCGLWAGVYIGIGFMFCNQMDRASEIVQQLGSSMIFLACALLALYLGWKYYNRRRFIKELRVARITPEELMHTIDSGKDVSIIDLRSATEFGLDQKVIPSAIWIDPARLELHEGSIPRDKEVVLYCS
jgi:membrane protein DedA with SNARE-associated domain